jgi:hypothetical protein
MNKENNNMNKENNNMNKEQNTDEQNIENIMQFPQHVSFKRRIKHEYKELTTKYSHVNAYTSNGNAILELTSKKKYQIVLTKNYPFEPPSEIYINGYRGSQSWSLTEPQLKLLYNMYNIKCLCCESYLCRSNWKALIKIDDIIKQFDNFIQIKQKIYIKLLVDKIVEKYANPDIDISSWL